MLTGSIIGDLGEIKGVALWLLVGLSERAIRISDVQ